MNIVLLGRPGSGKGTQGERLAAALGLAHVSTGNLLRHAVDAGTAVGRTVRSTMEQGQLVDDETMGALVADAVAATPGGMVLDGFPRTLPQCDSLLEVFGPDGVDLAVDIDVPVKVVLDRVRTRGRADDVPDVVLRRLWEYECQTRVVGDWFDRRARLVRVSGTARPDAVAADVLSAVRTSLHRSEAFA